MAQGENVLHVIKQATRMPEYERTDLIYGTVETVSPLTIRVSQKILLQESFLVLSFLCREFKTGVLVHTHPVPGGTGTSSAGDPSHTHTVNAHETSQSLIEVVVWRGLQVGDTVRMLRVAKGDKYYVIERELYPEIIGEGGG